MKLTIMAINENKYLIRFCQVGNGSKGGDAILIRLFDEKDNETLLLIDGGYKETGTAVIDFIKNNCTTTKIKIMFNTHPDRDHISGLKTILESDEVTVENLILNRPWRDAKFTKKMFEDKRITDNSLIKRLKDAFFLAEDVEGIAKKKGVKIYPQFRDENGKLELLNVLGPSKELYKMGLLASDKTPESYIESGLGDYTQVKYTEEDYEEGKEIEWYDDEVTSAVNQTSLILALHLGNTKVLFTGDAGKVAIKEALRFYKSIGGNPKDFTIVQLPHHGSRKNIDPEIINEFGNPDYIISCPPDGESEGHPSRRLINKILEINPKASIYMTKNHNFIFRKNVEINCSVQQPAKASPKMDGK